MSALAGWSNLPIPNGKQKFRNKINYQRRKVLKHRIDRVKEWVHLVVLLIMLCLGAPHGFGQEKKAFKAPRIDAYSKTEFSIYRGEKIRVKVEAQGADLQYKWIRASGVICTTASCTLDTDEWGLGRHRVVFIVYNQFGSLFLTYNIAILSPPIGYKPGDITVPIVFDTKAVEEVSVKDAVVSAIQGFGYSFHSSKVQVIGRDERTLEWVETLRTQAKGVLRFGRKGHESHTLFDNGVVHLSQSTPKRRALILGRGSLRSRQLNGIYPEWSILVADGSTQDGSQLPAESWLQIDPDPKCDLAILRHDAQTMTSKKKSGSTTDEEDESGDLSDSTGVSVQVYAGVARIFLQTGAFGEGQAWVIPAGFEVDITKPGSQVVQTKSKGVEILPLRVRKLQRVMKETTPEYRFGSEYDAALNGWVLVPKGDRAETLRNALLAARKSLNKGELLSALEHLSPYWISDKDDVTLRALAAEAYARLGWYDQVIEVFDESRPQLGQVEPKTFIYLGLLDLLESRWEQAYRSFLLAKDSLDTGGFFKAPDPMEMGLLDYYLGYAAFKAKELSAAEKAMLRVAENNAIPDYLRDSAKGFKREATNQRLWDLGLMGGLIYDSNILRTDYDLEQIAEGKFKKRSSMGLVSGAKASAWAFRNHDGQFGTIFNFRRVDYLESGLKDLAPLDQDIGIDSLLRFGLEKTTKEAWFETGLRAAIGMNYVGEERALDFLKASFLVGSPRLLNLNFEILNSLLLDPLPLRNDIYDPELQELVGATDRSHRSRTISLGFEPYRSNIFHIGLKGYRKVGVYRALDSKVDDFNIQTYRLYSHLKLPQQLFTGIDIEQAKETFTNQDPVKNQKILTTKVDFGIMNLWSLNHHLSWVRNHKTSTQEVNQYKRNVFEYLLKYDF